MSETVMYMGRIEKVAETAVNISMNDICKHIMNECAPGMEIPAHCDDYEDYFREFMHDKYAIVDGVLYKVHSLSGGEDQTLFQASRNVDGSISFALRFYNGGVGFDEALGRALKNLEQEEA